MFERIVKILYTCIDCSADAQEDCILSSRDTE